jgi:hypothetical protein
LNSNGTDADVAAWRAIDLIYMRVEVIERRDRGDSHWAWRFR